MNPPCPVQPVDFTWNKHTDRKFQFFDNHLVSLICSKNDPDMLEFFKLLSLCHTVMVEQKAGEKVININLLKRFYTVLYKHYARALETVQGFKKEMFPGCINVPW